MAFSDDAAPTRANIQKRLMVATDALASAIALSLKGPDKDDLGLIKELDQALSWAMAARVRIRDLKGSRRSRWRWIRASRRSTWMEG